MHHLFNNQQGGLIQVILLIIIVLLVLSYFGFNLRALLDDDQTQDNFSVVWEWLTYVWDNYLKAPAEWVWENIISFIWNDLFLDNLDRLRAGDTYGDIQPETPGVD